MPYTPTRRLLQIGLALILQALLVVTAGCSDEAPDPAPAETKDPACKSDPQTGDTNPVDAIRVKGSDTLLHLATTWAETFKTQESGSPVAITGGGSGTGLAALLKGECDIATASRKAKSKERDRALKLNKELCEFVVASDGICVVVHPSNPVTALSLSDLASVFTGAIAGWSDLGSDAGKILVLSRDKDSGTHAFFKEHVLQGKTYFEKARFLASNSAIIETIAEEPAAIGYVGLGYYESARQAVKAVAVKNADSDVLPSFESVRKGDYPISRTLQLYTIGKPAGDVRKFIDFALSDRGQALVTEMGFVPVR